MDSRSLTSVQVTSILATHRNAWKVLETASHATPVEAETSSAENHGRTVDSHLPDLVSCHSKNAPKAKVPCESLKAKSSEPLG